MMKLDKKRFDLIRAEKCMTFKKVTELSGVSAVTIRKGFKNKISGVAVGKIAKALGVPVKEIIIEEE